MGPFRASLRVAGDSSALPATLMVDGGRLTIRAGDQPIGDWSLKEIDLSRTEAGYRMKAEGEQLFLSVTDIAAFDEAVGQTGKKKRFGKSKGPGRSKSQGSSTYQESTSQESSSQESGSQGIISRVDDVIERAERRFGALLPPWVFSRATVLALLIGLLVTIFMPSLISSILLLAGLGTVVFGAVVYTDGHLAAKLLPGRSTPTHVLIVGVGILMVGVLLGVIAG